MKTIYDVSLVYKSENEDERKETVNDKLIKIINTELSADKTKIA